MVAGSATVKIIQGTNKTIGEYKFIVLPAFNPGRPKSSPRPRRPKKSPSSVQQPSRKVINDVAAKLSPPVESAERPQAPVSPTTKEANHLDPAQRDPLAPPTAIVPEAANSPGNLPPSDASEEDGDYGPSAFSAPSDEVIPFEMESPKESPSEANVSSPTEKVPLPQADTPTKPAATVDVPVSKSPDLRTSTIVERSDRKLVIELLDFPQQADIGGKTFSFDEVCARFSERFVNNSGLWSTGPFESASCVTGSSDENWTWKLRISGDEREKLFEIVYRDSDGSISTESYYSLETLLSPVLFLANNRIATLTAARLVAGLPFRSTIEKSQVNEGEFLDFTGMKLDDMPNPNNGVIIFTVKRGSGHWITKVIGEAAKLEDGAEPERWRVTAVDYDMVREIPEDEVIYIRETAGVEREKRKIDAELKSFLGRLGGETLNLVRSAYIGARYGMPLLSTGSIISGAPMWGLFAEFRGGGLAGLKTYYDFIPSQERDSGGSTERFKWSRFQLGYSVGRQIDYLVFNWIDVTPKLGLTSLSVTKLAVEDLGVTGYQFDLNRAPTLGLEVGIERRTNHYLGRLWGFGSYSTGISSSERAYTTTSQRLGVDIFHDIAKFDSLKLTGLGFAAIESTTITRNQSDSDLINSGQQAKQLKFNSIYLGGGLTMGW
jgi:hypothetical protein